MLKGGGCKEKETMNILIRWCKKNKINLDFHTSKQSFTYRQLRNRRDKERQMIATISDVVCLRHF